MAFQNFKQSRSQSRSQNFSFPTHEARADFQLRALHWLERFETAAVLDSHAEAQNAENQYAKSQYNWLLAAGAASEFMPQGETLPQLDAWLERQKSQQKSQQKWCFAALSYELKNEIEPQKISSRNVDNYQIPKLYFFCPEILFIIRKDAPLTLEIQSEAENPQEIWDAINNFSFADEYLPPPNLRVQAKFSHGEYIAAVESLKAEIKLGNVYEANLCQEYFLPKIDIPEPLRLFTRLNRIAKTPFAAYFRAREHHLCCASPERFLQHKDGALFSQPIKGTRRRGEDEASDQFLGEELLNSEKDRAENLMIVDLVRNDLARLCLPATVKVEELCQLYRFPAVLQLVSAISGRLPSPRPSFSQILRATFPMGSMTGAPKIAALQIIDQLERSQRGWYSGSIGYIAPSGDFDFNVVIRSFYYNQNQKILAWQVGGAIVYDSVAAEEYEECITKMRPLLQTLATFI
jgi:para-aminobenzoate synthetase component 1